MSGSRLQTSFGPQRVWVAAGIVVVLAAGAALGVALKALLAPSPVVPASPQYALVVADHGTVGRSIRLDVTARRIGGTAVVNAVHGVLTEHLVEQGGTVESGRRLYSVDLRPVVVAAGDVPAFRDLARGIKGSDVRQLQQMLVDVGARTADADGTFGAATQQQVRAWQERVGLPVTGTVPLGQLVFVPRLPGLADWADDVPLGTTLGAGSVIAEVVPDDVTFEMTVPEDQLGLLESGMVVEITAGDAELSAVIGKIVRPQDDAEAAVATIEPLAQSTVCDGKCEGIATAGDQILPARVVVLAPTEGIVVPAAALDVGHSGRAQVTLDDGTAVDVTVDAVEGGRAVVSGLEPGARVRVPVGGHGGA